MKAYLLDTNAALLALTQPSILPARVRRAILAGPNVLSAVVYWEVVLKAMKGALKVGEPRTWWLDAPEQLVATALVLRPEHVAVVYLLPPIHSDPFDRVLIFRKPVPALDLAMFLDFGSDMSTACVLLFALRMLCDPAVIKALPGKS